MKKSILILILLLLFFCYKSEDSLKDEFVESLNRRVYSFNRGIDCILFIPSTSVYVNVVPGVIDDFVGNFFRNSTECQNIVFNLFFYKFDNVINAFSRFLVNSTFGIFGIFDLSKMLNINYQMFDFNYVFNFSDSKYMVLPVVGPGTIRSHLCLLFIQLLNPYVYFFDKLVIYYFLEILNKKSQLIFDGDFFHNNMIDGYSFLKDAYIQNIGLRNNNMFLDEPPD